MTNEEKDTRAEYHPQVLPEYRGNPLNEALPPIMSVEEAVESLTMWPEYNKAERELDSYYRFHAIRRLLRYFQPLYTHIDIEQRISCGIRQGYLNRNPIYSRNKRYFGSSTALGFTIIGMSGVGKTTGVERVLSLYPQCITHIQYEDKPFYVKQIPWLKLDCPFDGSIKGLCVSFFNMVDKILESSYSQKFYSGRYTVDMMLPKMVQIAETHGIGCLIIDEVQHLSQAKSGGSAKMLNFFVNLVNVISIPVILIGTTKALPILQSEFRQARRGSGQGGLIWDRMQKDESWDILLQTMWKYQWTQIETPITDGLKNLLYDESQGIMDIAVKLYAMAQIKAISDETECITPTVIKEVAAERLGLVKPMLDALRSGDIKKIMQFEDIRPLDLDEYISAHISKLPQSVITGQKISTLEEYAILKLLEMDIPSKTARQCVKKVMTGQNTVQTLAGVVRKAFKMALQMDVAAGVSVLGQQNDIDDLRAISGKDPHKELKAVGVVSAGCEEW